MGKQGAYTKGMKLAEAQYAAQPRSGRTKVVAWAYAAVLVVMTLGQLFSFEKFLPLIEGYELPGGIGMATLIACLAVTLQVFAVPFLLRMPLSPLMRWVSLGSGIAVALLWLVLGIVAVASTSDMTNSGVLGIKVVVPFGIVQLLWAVVLAVLAAWSTWGLWPSRTK